MSIFLCNCYTLGTEELIYLKYGCNMRFVEKQLTSFLWQAGTNQLHLEVCLSLPAEGVTSMLSFPQDQKFPPPSQHPTDLKDYRAGQCMLPHGSQAAGSEISIAWIQNGPIRSSPPLLRFFQVCPKRENNRDGGSPPELTAQVCLAQHRPLCALRQRDALIPSFLSLIHVLEMSLMRSVP